jgi:hypothetical protein
MSSQESPAHSSHEERSSLEMLPDLALQQRIMIKMLPDSLSHVSLDSDGENIGAADTLFSVWAPVFGEGFRELSRDLQRATSGYEYELYTRMLENVVTEDDLVWLKEAIFARSPQAAKWNPLDILH